MSMLWRLHLGLKSHQQIGHLTEFWHFELESAWADLNDIMKLAEGFFGILQSRKCSRKTSGA